MDQTEAIKWFQKKDDDYAKSVLESLKVSVRWMFKSAEKISKCGGGKLNSDCQVNFEPIFNAFLETAIIFDSNKHLKRFVYHYNYLTDDPVKFNLDDIKKRHNLDDTYEIKFDTINLYMCVPVFISSLLNTRHFIYKGNNSYNIDSLPEKVKLEIKEIFNSWAEDRYPEPIDISSSQSDIEYFASDPIFYGTLCFICAHEMGHLLLLHDDKLREKQFTRAKKALYTTLDKRTPLTSNLCKKLKFSSSHDVRKDIINNWAIEVAADIVAFDICRNMKAYGDTLIEKELNKIFYNNPLYGVGFLNSIQYMIEVFYKGDQIDEFHPPSYLRLMTLENCIKDRRFINILNKHKLKNEEWKIPIMIYNHMSYITDLVLSES
ncbi:hypothetical protein MSKOL_1966 [Methanosarcina sp. Kolksee]|uniref:hypothetical protein n=1 Tax=Methanosarcina sp. Kolksee TaxID=1434099 RepID=UPI000615F32E|nr:hypothetical protein [Methanosarcina sp. Kolksee]AKB47743.1 hypothetical protein MSKOL_1966 [Methanosarcina sp. Kolksee]